ncbi:hypothetical protein MTR67_028153 [Solanum verrucosum]|uniref:Uncharacterized protein n=1 Tax=Solanum verrucosum TaxID=315347 RepID=A0AAF0R526_SOLVR|nr:hypothetical protein MTR67_028153 [Solanum verrucosum]
MLEVSSSKPLASESKGFAFWVELIALGLPSAGYLSYVHDSSPDQADRTRLDQTKEASTGREGSSRAVFAKTMLNYYQHRLVLYYFVMVDRFSAIVGKITVVAILNNMPSIFPRVGSGEGGM